MVLVTEVKPKLQQNLDTSKKSFLSVLNIVFYSSFRLNLPNGFIHFINVALFYLTHWNKECVGEDSFWSICSYNVQCILLQAHLKDTEKQRDLFRVPTFLPSFINVLPLPYSFWNFQNYSSLILRTEIFYKNTFPFVFLYFLCDQERVMPESLLWRFGQARNFDLRLDQSTATGSFLLQRAMTR
jgi:hypothetical protein